jgi:hypothetical protein
MEITFEGWPAEAPALLEQLAADNTPEFWTAHRDRFEAGVCGPMQALARALEPGFGTARVFRPQVNRRFRPDAPPYRTDTGCLARSAGGCVLGVVLSSSALTVSAGHRAFDGPQLRRYRAAVGGEAGAELGTILDALDGWAVEEPRMPAGRPRGYAADHPRLGLLRHRGLQVGRGWELGCWLQTAAPLERVREAWLAAGPLVGWLDEHVGPADPVPPRPRPPALPLPDGVGAAGG